MPFANREQFLSDVAAQVYGALDYYGQVSSDRLRVDTGIQGPPRSLPFEAPHMDTTALNKSIAHTVYQDVTSAGGGAEAVGVAISEDTPYALFVELGHDGVAPRPHMYPEMERVLNSGLTVIGSRIRIGT